MLLGKSMATPMAHVGSIALALVWGCASAQDTDLPRLPAVVVTAPGADGTLRSVPHGLSVITADDIARSTATSVTDLLSREANLNLKSFYGNDKGATIDIRGMGDTANSSVLILVDGVRLNELDSSGADLSSVPLSQIERVEVLRGGGAVRYGDGAVGGVINIITKRGKPGPATVQLQVARGAYGMGDTRLHARGGVGPLGLGLYLSELNTDGFRSNSDLTSRNASAEVRLLGPAGLDFLEAWVRVARHEDRNGFPGPVSAADFASGSAARRSTKTPFDFGQTTDSVGTTGLFADFDAAGRIELQASYRDRNNDYVLGFNTLLPLASQLSTITSKRHDVQLRYDNDITAFGMKHSLSAGINSQSGSYARYSNGRQVPGQSEQKLGDVQTHGVFAAATLRATSALSFNLGLRENRFSTGLRDERFTQTCAFSPFPVLVCTPFAFALQKQAQGKWRNHGSELGITWQASPDLTTFVSSTRHFRNPNLDELVVAAADLRPQSGRTVEAGARWSSGPQLELAATLFEIRNQDEIYYGADPTSGLSVNRNYELPTRRTGAELEARWLATPDFSLRANLGHLLPRFVGANADIPHVPRLTANLQAQWKLSPQWRWSAALRHVGKRFDGNDFTNTKWPQLPAYTVVDTAWQVALGQAELAFGINNLFNRAYSTLGYSATYYPMPERNAYLRLRFNW